MIYNINELRKDTVALIKQIDAQIAEVQAVADEHKVPVNKIQDSHGNWILNPLLLAKAMAYNTLVTLQTDERSASRR